MSVFYSRTFVTQERSLLLNFRIESTLFKFAGLRLRGEPWKIVVEELLENSTAKFLLKTTAGAGDLRKRSSAQKETEALVHLLSRILGRSLHYNDYVLDKAYL